MKIAIVEVMPRGHATLVISLVQIFTADPFNEVTVLTRTEAAKAVDWLIRRLKVRCSIRIVENDEDLPGALRLLGEERYDRIYVATLEKYFKEINAIVSSNPLFLVIHNIDDWFGNSFRSRLYRVVHSMPSFRKLIFAVKANIVYPRLRARIVRKVFTANGKFVVLNPVLADELARFISSSRIEVVPFSVYDAGIEDKSGTEKIRICIPGMVSRLRRDYDSVINMIQRDFDFFRDYFEIDLLGGVDYHDGGGDIVAQFKRLASAGLTVHCYEREFIDFEEFDLQLSKADILLGNLNVSIDKYSAYGKTKETGIPYAMLHAAKPGLFVDSYALPPAIVSSSVLYGTIEDLHKILHEFIFDRKILDRLKKAAKVNSELYSPKRIYDQLVGEQS